METPAISENTKHQSSSHQSPKSTCRELHSDVTCKHCYPEIHSTPNLGSSGPSQEESTKISKNNTTSFHIGSNEELDKEDDDPLEDISNLVINEANSVRKVETDSENKSDDSDSEDEQVRSRTPLLARHSSLEQKSKNNGGSQQGSGLKKEGETVNQCKRVSFSTRSLDGSQHYYHQHHKGRSKQYDISKDRDIRHGKEKRRKNSGNRRNSDVRAESGVQKRSESASEVRSGNDNRADEEEFNPGTSNSVSASADNVEDSSTTEKRFALVPQNDSMIGWNQAGGPFPSQWLFQAVNVAVKAITSSMTGSSAMIGSSGGNFSYFIF